MPDKSLDLKKGISSGIGELKSQFSEFEKLSKSVDQWNNDPHYRDLWDNLLISIRILEKVADSYPQERALLNKYFNNMSVELDRVADYCANTGESDTAEVIASMQRSSKRLEKLIS